MSNMLVVSFVVLLLPNFLVEVFDPNWDLPELHIAGYIICWSWIFISPAVCILGCAHFRLAFKETYTKLISRCENQDTNTVNSRFKKVHFSSLKSRVVWFKKDLCSESKNRLSEKNALCRWICNLRSFLNREFTVSDNIMSKKNPLCHKTTTGTLELFKLQIHLHKVIFFGQPVFRFTT